MLFRYKIPATTVLATLLVIFTSFTSTHGLFNGGFQSFLNQKYGATVAKQLTRADLGINGSFGGNDVATLVKVFRDPVVLVHGLNNNAGSLISIRDFFTAQGFGFNGIYATSYGPNATIIDASSPINCSYVKQIRQLLAAVALYTNKRVGVIAYSLGTPIARKAILGGSCVDTKENLGTALTSQISFFLSVAGANLGAAECNSFPTAQICNAVNGFKAGSAFLKDINSKSGYEGESRYSIGSKSDDIVGFANLTLPAAQINVTLNNFTHGDTCLNTVNIQFSLILRGGVAQRTVDKDSYAESQLTNLTCSGTVSGGSSTFVAPHQSQSQARGDGDDVFHGEYNRQNKVWTFVNGFNYTKHTDPTKSKFFSIRNKPIKA